MEQLLFLLFVLFSVITALLERRKRKKALEEAHGTQDDEPTDARRGRGQEEEEAFPGGWPFPMGGDPFEPRLRRQDAPEAPKSDADQPAVTEEEGGRSSVVTPAERGYTLVETLERQARETEERARRLESTASEVARQAEEAPRRLDVQKLLSTHESRESKLPASPLQTERPLVRRWTLTARKARSAIVYAEILGPPKALREQDQVE